MTDATPFNVSVDTSDPSRTVIYVRGDVDMLTANELGSCFRATADGDIVVDLSGVSFMDTSGLMQLLIAATGADVAGRSFFLRSVPGHVARLIELTGFESIMPTEAS
jgi:anti-sigma B factor antagonist